MGCHSSRHEHVDFDVVGDKLPSYTETVAHEGPTDVRSAVQLAIDVATETNDVIAATLLLVEASELKVHAPDLDAKLLALLLVCRTESRMAGCTQMVKDMSETAIRALREKIGPEERPRVVAELAVAVRRSDYL